MNPLPRRRFLLWLPALGAGLGLATPRLLGAAPARRFTLDLTPGAIGVSGNPIAIIELARAHGFESVQPDAGFLARQDPDGISRVTDALAKAGLRWGAAGLPVEFRRDEETFRRDIDRLPTALKALHQAGVTRIGTWLMPGHNELTEEENWDRHVRRLREVARLCRDAGLHLGLEYVGTPSVRARFKFPFAYRLASTRRLIADLAVPGTGVILDSWHWWMAGDGVADVAALPREEVVAVDLNDAPAGIPAAEQQDNRRELPLATGVIPVQGFLRALVDIGYDGPVRAEPFNNPLNALDNEAACARTIAALRQAAALVEPASRA